MVVHSCWNQFICLLACLLFVYVFCLSPKVFKISFQKDFRKQRRSGKKETEKKKKKKKERQRPTPRPFFPLSPLAASAQQTSSSAWPNSPTPAHFLPGPTRVSSPLWHADNRDPAVSRPLPCVVRRPVSVRERNRAPIPGLTRFWQDSRASVSYKVQGGSLPPSVTSRLRRPNP
jgi:hypothetical protein